MSMHITVKLCQKMRWRSLIPQQLGFYQIFYYFKVFIDNYKHFPIAQKKAHLCC